MFGSIIRPFRAAHRALGRTSIVTRETQALSDTRKTLLSFRAACENSKAEVGKYTERVARLHGDLATELARQPEKRRFDWLRFDNNTLLVAIKDDLYEAEKKLHEQLANYESNMANCTMFEMREQRLAKSLELRTGMAEKKSVQEAPAGQHPTLRTTVHDTVASHVALQGRKPASEVSQARPKVELDRFSGISPTAA